MKSYKKVLLGLFVIFIVFLGVLKFGVGVEEAEMREAEIMIYTDTAKIDDINITYPENSERAIELIEINTQVTRQLTYNCANIAADEYDEAVRSVCIELKLELSEESDCELPEEVIRELDDQYREKLNKCS